MSLRCAFQTEYFFGIVALPAQVVIFAALCAWSESDEHFLLNIFGRDVLTQDLQSVVHSMEGHVSFLTFFFIYVGCLEGRRV